MANPAVAQDYLHRDKICLPRKIANVGDHAFKWYDIAFAEESVPDDIRAIACAHLEALETPPGEGGFVILHRCGDGNFYFLIVQTWLGNNELWESVYAKRAQDSGFMSWPRPGPHLPTYCVWELGAVAHERLAWRRYLLSTRDAAAKAAHLADQYSGTV